MTSSKFAPIFLDNNSTTPRDPRVLDKYLQTETKFFGNSGSNHLFGWQAEEVIDLAKIEIAKLVNADPNEVFFTSGATEANNLLIFGFYKQNKENLGVSLATSKIDHQSVIAPLLALQKQGIQVSFLPNNQIGIVDTNSSIKSSFISLHSANNEIGAIQNISQLRNNFPDSFIHSDACQAIGKIPIDLKNSSINCLTLSAHKAYGPMGIGAIVFSDFNSRSKIASQILGGNQQSGLRAGTMTTSLIAAFGETAKIARIELEENANKLNELSKLFLDIISGYFQEVTLIGPDLKERLPGNLSLRFKDVAADRLVSKLSSKIAFSTGSACHKSGEPSHVLKALSANSDIEKEVIRIGIGKFNTKDEIITAAEQIGKIATSIKNR